MEIKGSPTSMKLFGINCSDGKFSQDLFDDFHPSSVNNQQKLTTPRKKRPCFRSPKLSAVSSGSKQDTVSSLSAAVSNSVQGIYCSQERKSYDSSFQGDVWNAFKLLRDNEILNPYNIKSTLNGKCLYHGKVAHLAVLVKSVEYLSQKDTSLILYDDTGEIKAAVHKRVMEKHGALLEPGVGLLLRQSTIFSFNSMQKYINITLPNVVHIYNTASLAPPQQILDKHLLEVSEINIQKEENPDTENQTPNITINTPNRPPPPRVTRNTPKPNTPQNQTPQNGQTPQRTWTPRRSRFQQTNQTPPIQRNQTPQKNPNQPSNTTPQRTNAQQDSKTPQRNSFYQRDQSGAASTTDNRKREGAAGEEEHNKKREGAAGEEGHNKKKIKLTPPHCKEVASNTAISPKEQEEITKLLEDIDDTFFEEF